MELQHLHLIKPSNLHNTHDTQHLQTNVSKLVPRSSLQLWEISAARNPQPNLVLHIHQIRKFALLYTCCTIHVQVCELRLEEPVLHRWKDH